MNTLGRRILTVLPNIFLIKACCQRFVNSSKGVKSFIGLAPGLGCKAFQTMLCKFSKYCLNFFQNFCPLCRGCEANGDIMSTLEEKEDTHDVTRISLMTSSISGHICFRLGRSKSLKVISLLRSKVQCYQSFPQVYVETFQLPRVNMENPEFCCYILIYML